MLNEIWLHIFEYLTVEELLQCNLVSKCFYHLINTNRIWKRLCYKNFDQNRKDCFVLDFNWTLEPLCAGKLCYINGKVVRNWKTDCFRKIHLNMPFSSNFDIIGYNGQILVLKNNKKITAYEIQRAKNVESVLRQVLEIDCETTFKSLLINDTYLIVNNGRYLAIYRFNSINHKYEINYIFYVRNDHNFCLKEVNNDQSGNNLLLDDQTDVDSLSLLSNSLYVICSTVNGRSKICAINLENGHYLMTRETKDCLAVSYKENLYLLDRYGEIMGLSKLYAYDKYGQMVYSEDCPYFIARLHVNNHIILAVKQVLIKNTTLNIDYCVLGKTTGYHLYSKSICEHRSDYARICSAADTLLLPTVEQIILVTIYYKHGCGSLFCSCPPNKAFLLYELATGRLIRTIDFWANQLLLGADRFFIDPNASTRLVHNAYNFINKKYTSFHTHGGTVVYAAYDLLLLKNCNRCDKNLILLLFS